MFTTEEGNLIISSCIICFANARKYSEEILRRLTFKYFNKVAVSLLFSFSFCAIAFYGGILSLVLHKVFSIEAPLTAPVIASAMSYYIDSLF